MQFKAGMVIYVEGDNDDRVFVLQNGVVDLSYSDIETGEFQHDVLKPGEFFGVKSALGKHPREETAHVARDCGVVVFTPAEFEAMVMKNPKIILQMLKVYSTQLRKVNLLLSSVKISTHARRKTGQAVKDDAIAQPQNKTSAEESLFRLGEYYLRKEKFYEAEYVFRNYVRTYPAGAFVGEAKETLSLFGGKNGA
jgi:CRP-like cAMP-binding protein